MALTTYNEILNIVRDDRAAISEARYVEDYLGEMADGYVPIYTSEVISEWCDLPSDERDCWQEIGAGEGDTIDRLMAIDLWLYYRSQFERAWREIEDEHICDTTLMPEISISPSGTMAVCECGYKCAYWECACELNDHDHPTENN